MGKKKSKGKAPKERDVQRLEQPDMSPLSAGPYPRIFPFLRTPRPLPFHSFLDSLFETPAECEPSDCVRETWEDREQTEGYVYNAYVSAPQEAQFGQFYSGVVASVVEPPAAPRSGTSPISLTVVHNLDGSTRVNNTYLSIEQAKQLVNQIGQAINVAESRAVAKS